MGRLNGNGREFEDFLVLQVGVGSAVSASLARQIESAVDWPDRVEGAGVAALERHLARPVVVDPVLRSPVFLSALINSIIICVRMAVILVFKE